jgi:hypothetical protein
LATWPGSRRGGQGGVRARRPQEVTET